ncbi:MAG: hypothetical protein GKR92_11990 [Gammaproteobacteria bacterium]|nr:MAG: hypothetical protein GKR92_11990 [Gammaproteobacteria bacterium]
MAIWSSRSNKKNLPPKVVVKAAISPSHCVEVNMPYDACEKVLELHGKRFLSAEAPELPQPGCDQYCKCKFKHYNDRRQDERRDAFSSSGIHFSGEKNRRLDGDRRRNSAVRVGF